MNKKGLELKVGLFVSVALVLLALLMIQFSKGQSLFHPTYQLHMEAPNVGGLKKGAKILLAGVTVGNVGGIDLGPQGTNVLIDLDILEQYPVYGDARFVIQQAGFLGDEYVAIVPGRNELPPFEDGDQVFCEAPFDLQAVARDAAGFLQRIDQTARELHGGVTDLRQNFLNDQTLSNLTETATSLRRASEQTESTVQSVNALIASNRAAVDGAVGNLETFSVKLNSFADAANGLVESNAPTITDTIEDLRASAESLRKLLNKADSGDNLAAAVLADEELARRVSDIAYNLSITSSNLNERGLWGIMWKSKPPKQARKDPAFEPLRSPGDPFH